MSLLFHNKCFTYRGHILPFSGLYAAGYHFKFITVQPNCVRRIAWTNNSLLHPRQDNGHMDPMTSTNIVNLLHLPWFEFAINQYREEKNSLWNKHIYIYIGNIVNLYIRVQYGDREDAFNYCYCLTTWWNTHKYSLFPWIAIVRFISSFRNDRYSLTIV